MARIKECLGRFLKWAWVQIRWLARQVCLSLVPGLALLFIGVIVVLVTRGFRGTWEFLMAQLGPLTIAMAVGLVSIFLAVVQFRMAQGISKNGRRFLIFYILIAATFWYFTVRDTFPLVERWVVARGATPTLPLTPTPSATGPRSATPTATATPTQTPSPIYTATPKTEEDLIEDVLTEFERLGNAGDFYSIYHYLHTGDFRIRNPVFSDFERGWNYTDLEFRDRDARIIDADSTQAQLKYTFRGRKTDLTYDEQEWSFCMAKVSGEWLINDLVKSWEDACWNE